MEKLTIQDVKTPTTPGSQYLAKITDARFKSLYQSLYNEYNPKLAILEQIHNWLNNHNENLTIIAIGAEWCPDCRNNISPLLKIEMVLNDPRFRTEIMSGVKTNPLRRSGADIVWAVPPSPPEVADPKFEVKAIPMLYLFLKSGNCIGKITENPSHTKSIEEELFFYLNQVKK